MMGINHWEVLRKLDGTSDGKTKGIITTFADNKIVVSKYFIKSTYKDDSGKENKQYLCTKMGCEFLSNKFNGEKGILFSAKYVERFNQMEQHIIQESQFKLPQTFKEALLQLVEQVEINEKLQIENVVLVNENKVLSDDITDWANENIINSIIRKYGANIRNDFGGAWTEWKKNLLYRYSININSRITNYLNETGKKTKPRTLSMLRGKEELTMGLKTAITMCKEENIDISDILGKHLSDADFKVISDKDGE